MYFSKSLLKLLQIQLFLLDCLVSLYNTVEPLYNGPPKSGQTLYNGLLPWNGIFSIYLHVRCIKNLYKRHLSTPTNGHKARPQALNYHCSLPSATVKTAPLGKPHPKPILYVSLCVQIPHVQVIHWVYISR